MIRRSGLWDVSDTERHGRSDIYPPCPSYAANAFGLVNTGRAR